MRTRVASLLLAALAGARAQATPRQIDWIELAPAEERATFDPAPPAPAHDYLLGEESGGAAKQSLDYRVNRELEGQEIRIPGFVVPLELKSMYSAYWISGRMVVKLRTTRYGAAAYTLVASASEEYKF